MKTRFPQFYAVSCIGILNSLKTPETSSRFESVKNILRGIRKKT